MQSFVVRSYGLNEIKTPLNRFKSNVSVGKYPRVNFRKISVAVKLAKVRKEIHLVVDGTETGGFPYLSFFTFALTKLEPLTSRVT